MNNNFIFDTIIIGGGPAGLFCAAKINGEKDIDENSGKKILILEKKKLCGRKLLITGTGQCNITNTEEIKKFPAHYGGNGNFLKPSFSSFSNTDLISYFQNRGLPLVTDKNGKIFPESKKAADVLDLLIRECEKGGVRINTDDTVIRTEYLNNKLPGDPGLSGENISEEGCSDRTFVIHTENNRYECRNLVVATGGMTYPATGSAGDGYRFAKGFGHTVISPSPALAAVYTRNSELSELSGISFEDVKVSLFRDNNKISEQSGDLLITHKGFSGPCVLHLSRHIVPGDHLRISFISGKNPEIFRQEITAEIEGNSTKMIRKVLSEFGLPDRFVRKYLDISEISEDLTCAHLNKKMRNRIISGLLGYEVRVDSLSGLNEAMVTKGGVDLKEINRKTMESKIISGLYFIGEVLDIDGDTGGYNLQAAFSTAFAAARAVSSKKIG
ncbi:NAD(P)/FAD-dependent oxidoreductase [Methanoplanus endosymbiosus]|uniref:NAD(P)/FAD-dependent oxidoreductase n=1 Tax=Methanoplanus endosymbiosus TaxID=33865 RepID=A0A9E7PQS1_9EURY|nr:NAD(P)/FAD-dependent oxidoreductase [Methanoplanus endosymbiosus]UUX93096.1 NAD(P)/FAD-dependent oxidoreductase [Methanoplanus endosymbiosus]